MAVVDRNFLTDGTGRAIAEELGAVATAIENSGGGGGSSLPAVTSEDNGDVLTVVNGAWNKATPSGGSSLPAVTSEDNGDVLTVVNGAWNKATPSGGGGVLIVQVTQTEADSTVATADKTYAEVMAAIQSGKQVYAIFNHHEGTSHYPTYNTLTLSAYNNEAIDFYQADIGDDVIYCASATIMANGDVFVHAASISADSSY